MTGLVIIAGVLATSLLCYYIYILIKGDSSK